MSFFEFLDKIQKEEYSIAIDLWDVLPDPKDCDDPEKCCVWKGELTSNIEGALDEAGYYIDRDTIGFDDETKEKIKARIKKDLEDYRKLKRTKTTPPQSLAKINKKMKRERLPEDPSWK